MEISNSQKTTGNEIEKAKKAAAVEAVKLVSNNSFIGLGSGTTMEYFIKELGEHKIKEENYNIKAVTTSYDAQFLADKYNIPVLGLEGVKTIPLTIDGADAIDSDGNVIKGRGGAQILEKIVASLSEHYVLIVDERKIVNKLSGETPIPVEIIPEAAGLVMKTLKSMNCKATLRYSSGKVGPVITDLGNMIIDTRFENIDNVFELDQRLNNITGVIGHGLFVNKVDQVIVGFVHEGKAGVRIHKFKR